jgi:hypothetical protein
MCNTLIWRTQPYHYSTLFLYFCQGFFGGFRNYTERRETSHTLMIFPLSSNTMMFHIRPSRTVQKETWTIFFVNKILNICVFLTVSSNSEIPYWQISTPFQGIVSRLFFEAYTIKPCNFCKRADGTPKNLVPCCEKKRKPIKMCHACFLHFLILYFECIPMSCMHNEK